MRNILASILFSIGCLVFFVGIMQYYESKTEGEKALSVAKEIKEEFENDAVGEKKTREEFYAQENEVIGLLKIPKIDAEIPIIQGTTNENLKRGVGHIASTSFPTDGEQIVLSAHRDTFFRRLKELGNGDRFIVELPYGSFTYEMRDSKIIDEDDTNMIGSIKGEEVLNITTCYPFRYIGPAPKRYVIYAYPIKE